MRYQTIQEFNSNTALTPIKDLSRNPKLFIPSPILLLMLAACGGGDSFSSIENLIGSNYNDRLFGDANNNVINGGDGNDRIGGRGGVDTYIGGAGNDTFITLATGEGEIIIKDFTKGQDKVEVSLLSTVGDLASLYTALSITETNDTDHTGNGELDTVLRLERGATGDAGDFLIVFEGFTDDLALGNFIQATD